MTKLQEQIASEIISKPYRTNYNLTSYINEYGTDEFAESMYTYISAHVPQISLICLHCDNNYVQEYINQQQYSNLEIAHVTDNETWDDIIDYIQTTSSEYLLFLEPKHEFFEAVLLLQYRAMMQNNADIVLAPRDITNDLNEVISFPDPILLTPLYEDECLLSGKGLVSLSIQTNRNLYGDLSTIMVRTSYARSVLQDSSNFNLLNPCIQKTAFLYQLLTRATIKLLEGELVTKKVSPFDKGNNVVDIYCNYLTTQLDHLNITTVDIERIRFSFRFLPRKTTKYKKDITFIYQDKGEYYNVLPLADEAKQRGYNVTMTMDKQQKAEIAVYQEHTNYPENARFSAILLHDLAQGHNRWPNFWELEPWDKYDFGILPGEQWHELWRKNGCMPYSTPVHGVFCLGYPKSDIVTSKNLLNRANELKAKLKFKYDYTVLYAVSWENDGKEDDFVKALHDLPINLLIKAASWKGGYMDTYYYIEENIRAQRELHEGKFDNVYYLEPEESIMTALQMCDMVLSDESSVMGEALMFGKPSLAIIDWTVQDNPPPAPPRLSDVQVDYVFTCKRADMRENVLKIMQQQVDIQPLLNRKDSMYSNLGQCCSDIMDAIEYYTNNGENTGFLAKTVSNPYYEYQSLWN